MTEPRIQAFRWLESIAPQAVAWASPSVRNRVARELNVNPVTSLEEVPVQAETLIVVGGGTMLDEAKAFRARVCPGCHLVLVPSLWGSGAENSPVAVLNRNGAKEIAISEIFLPDTIVYWPELLETVSPERARHACGDALAHALEAFLSPLAADPLRRELATLLLEMLELPLAVDPRWFRASARASRLQAQASVGLVHGIAHTLEYPLRSHDPGGDWGHSKLCAVFLAPVVRFNREFSSKFTDLMTQYGLDSQALTAVLDRLFEPEAYARAVPFLEQHWMKVLRDPCSRTNSVLVRPGSLAFFTQLVAA